jgi:hypothetical protein
MFWIAIAIVIVGYLWSRAATQNHSQMPQHPISPPRPPPAIPPQRDAATFGARASRALEAGDLPLAVATIEQEVRPALSDVAEAMKALYGNTLSGAGRAARAQIAAARAQHFAVVARCIDLLASKINGQRDADEPSKEKLARLAAEALEARVAGAQDDIVEIVEGIERMEALRDPGALLEIARKMVSAAERMSIRLSLLCEELLATAEGLEQVIEKVGPDAATFQERFSSAFDSADYSGATEIAEKEMGYTLLLAIRRAAELHDHLNGCSTDVQNLRRANALVEVAEHLLDVTHGLVLSATTVADLPTPAAFTKADSRAILARLGELAKQEGWGNLVVESFVAIRKEWETALQSQADATEYLAATERLRWHSLTCLLWAKLIVVKLESAEALTAT